MPDFENIRIQKENDRITVKWHWAGPGAERVNIFFKKKDEEGEPRAFHKVDIVRIPGKGDAQAERMYAGERGIYTFFLSVSDRDGNEIETVRLDELLGKPYEISLKKKEEPDGVMVTFGNLEEPLKENILICVIDGIRYRIGAPVGSGSRLLLPKEMEREPEFQVRKPYDRLYRIK